MKKIMLLLSMSIIFCSCKSNKHLSYNYESETLKIKQLSECVFVHISYLETNDYGKVACNGMVYFNDDEAIVFDTPINNDVSKELIHWIEKEQKKNIIAIVVTHFHEDCLGGLQQFHNHGTKSYASNATIKLVKQDSKKVIPKYGFENKTEIKVGRTSVLTKFFGEGHTRDNIVGYIPNENALFGGCLIKSVKANKGYLGDANTLEWSNTVEKIKKEIPDLKIVVPGHGKSGSTELLDYTISLFKTYKKAN
ncbi:subclass B1 metallo-beta-lactamase [Flavivirga algicola]|uniref:beta-lactamase n=1 Tax=Flavivirga algicola TaxID=2729136 RepID=A0ABX1S1X7_9FLAO|nr:subclass B1 metallo-beta-lactamase [Flavivirga algicola]NMH88893.1 subclass B1 metallo-beta-lactamase [Flavivirga algicola]